MGLVGREKDLGALIRHVLDQDAPVVALTGRPGVGKSALLTEAVREWDRRALTVWRADLKEAAGDVLVDEIARALGVWPPAAGETAAVDALSQAIAHGRVVLAVDHAEIADAGDALGTLARRCPGLTVVLTTNRPVAFRAATVALAPLAVPMRDSTTGEALTSPSVQMFIENAELVDARLTLDDADIAAIAETCRLVGGLPLAIELAAARVRLLSPAQVARQLGRDSDRGVDLDFLESAPTSIRPAFAATRAMLGASQDALLTLLAGYSGPVPLGAAVDVSDRPLGAVLDDLERLVELRLVEPSNGFSEPAFALLPIVRAFVREGGATEAADERRATYLRVLAAQAADARATLTPSDAQERLRVMRKDVAVLLRRLARTDLPGATVLAVDAASVLEGYEEGVTIGEVLDLAIRGRVDEGLDARTRAGVWLWSSRMLALSRDGVDFRDLVAERWRRGIELVDAAGWPPLALQARMVAVHNGSTTGDLRLSAQAAAEGRELAQRAAEPAWTARFELWAAGAVHHTDGPDAARRLALASLERAQRIGDLHTHVWAIMMLNTLPPAVPAGPPLPSLERGLELSRRLGDPVLESFLYAAMTMREHRARRYGSAAHWCARRLELGVRRGWTALQGISILHAVLIAGAVNGRGCDEFTARMIGVARPDLERVLMSMAPSSRPLYEQVAARTRARLGAERFSSLVAEGGVLSDVDAASDAISWLHEHESEPAAASANLPAITPRETEVLGMLANGLTNKEIAARMRLSAKTVMHHSVSIYRKLGVRGRSEATAFAFRHGLLGDLDAAG